MRFLSSGTQQQHHYFTYMLGTTLYIPLTSRSNACTLPFLRGPNLFLPPSTVAALCRVRDAESHLTKWEPWCVWLDGQEQPQRMPVPLPLVAELPVAHPDTNDNNNVHRPTVDELLHEIDATANNNICIAGEGEPLLRLDAVLSLAQALQTTPYSSQRRLRLHTNGLVQPHVATQLKDSGLDQLTIHLISSNAVQYQQLMEPILEQNVDAWEMVCAFVKAAVQASLDVEIAAIDRPDIHQPSLELLTQALGVTRPVRWRSYHP